MFNGSGSITVMSGKGSWAAGLLSGSFSTVWTDGAAKDKAVTIEIKHDWDSFDEDRAISLLEETATCTLSGEIQMAGPEGGLWRYRFEGGRWLREEGTVIWTPSDKGWADGCRVHVLLGRHAEERRRGAVRAKIRVLGVYADRKDAEAEMDRLDFDEHVKAFVGSGRDWDFEIEEAGLKA